MSAKVTKMKKLLEEPLDTTMTIRLGPTTKAGVREIAAYCGESEEEVLRRFAILPAAVFLDSKSLAESDSTSLFRAECICVSADTQLQTYSLYWLKGVNSRRCESSMKWLFIEPPESATKLKLGSSTRTGLRAIAKYCGMTEEEFLRRTTAIFVRTLEDVRSQAEYDLSADLKAVFMYASGDNKIVKGNTFIFRPGKPSFK